MERGASVIFSGGAGIHDLAAMFAGARTDVDDPVRVSDGVLVMFDDDQRVAEVAQMMQCTDQPFVVTLMQADGWFVQHIHDAHRAGADRVASRMRCASPPDRVFAARDNVR